MAQIGSDCKLYHNTGTYATPTWDEVPIVRDLELNLEKGQADITTRAGAGWIQRIGTLKDGSIEFGIVWESGDADFEAFRDAFLDNTLIDVAAMDGAIATSGNQGLRAEMECLSFSRSEPVAGAVEASVNVSPGFSTNAPEWLVVSS